MIRASALLAMGLSAILTSPVTARDDCDLITALAGPGLRDVAIVVDDGGTLGVAHYGRTGLLGGARSCAMSIRPANLFLADDDVGLECEWEYDSLDEAQGRLSQLLSQVNACLPEQMEQQFNLYAVEDYRVAQEFAGEYVMDNEGASYDLRIHLVITTIDGAEQYIVNFNFDR